MNQQVEQINENVAKHGLEITSTFTSAFTRVNHFMHPDASIRQTWLNWFKKFADISVQMGAKTTGSH